MNKQGLWFLTLFSLILVLSVYYITMPNEIFKNAEVITSEDTSLEEEQPKDTSVNSQNINQIEALKVELDSKRAEILDTLQAILSDKSKSSKEKNDAYEQMKQINSLKARETAIIKKIKDEYGLNAYVKEENTKVEVIVDSEEHDVKLANKIMRTVQSSFDNPMSISVKFS